MANSLYTSFKENLLLGTFGNLTTATLEIMLINHEGDGGVGNSYQFSATHTTLADVNATTRGPSVVLQNVTVSGNVLDADDAVFSNVATLTTPDTDFDYAIIYVNTGTSDAEKFLAVFIDTATGLTGGQLIPNGSDITCRFSASGIFGI